jgi:RNA polymerase sigma-70 factor (ECF subfamily)
MAVPEAARTRAAGRAAAGISGRSGGISDDRVVPSAPPPAEVEANLARAQAGDPDALRVLFRTYQPRLLRFLRGLEPTVADDLAGEVWLAVAVRLDGFVGSERDFRAWLFAVARNRLADHRRRAARRPRLVAIDGELVDTAPDHGRSGSGDPAELAIEHLGAQAAIDALVADLTPEQAEVVLLRIVGGLSVEEVATLTARSPGAVRMLQHRALSRLATRSVSAPEESPAVTR